MPKVHFKVWNVGDWNEITVDGEPFDLRSNHDFTLYDCQQLFRKLGIEYTEERVAEEIEQESAPYVSPTERVK